MKKILILLICLTVVILSVGCAKEQATTTQEGTKIARNTDRPNVTGIVTAILGNEVTMEAREIPQFDREAMKEQMEKLDREKMQNMTQEERQKYLEENGISFGGGKDKEKAKTETKVINIPVGVPVVEIEYTEDGAEEEEIDMKDIKAGDTLNIWYAEDGKSIIKVAVVNMENATGGRGGFGGFGGGRMGGGFGGPTH